MLYEFAQRPQRSLIAQSTLHPTDHLTLSQTERQIMRTMLLLPPPRIVRPSYGPAAMLNAS